MFFTKIRLLYPKFLAIIFLLVSFVPFRLVAVDTFFPAVDWMIIYYWCIYAPQLMRSFFVAGLGFFRDALSGVPLGMNALTNLLLRMMVLYKGDDWKGSFIFIWQGFAIVVAVLLFVQWGFFSLIEGQLLGVETAVMQYIFTVLLYPVFHSMCNLIFLTLPRNAVGVTDKM